jgi:hypothetical protein
MRARFAIPALGMLLTGIVMSQAALGQAIDLGPDGLRVRPPEFVPEGRPAPRDEVEDEISEEDAVRIARSEGMRRVERVREGRRGWVVVGIDRNGDDMRVMIGRDGEVMDVQRE